MKIIRTFESFNKSKIFESEDYDMFDVTDILIDEYGLYDITQEEFWDCFEKIDGSPTSAEECAKLIADVYNKNEGRAYKANTTRDNDVKIDTMRAKVKNHIKSLECTTKQLGNDLEVYCNDDYKAQVMFRSDYIGIKKDGNKFDKQFKYKELGKIKLELNKILK